MKSAFRASCPLLVSGPHTSVLLVASSQLLLTASALEATFCHRCEGYEGVSVTLWILEPLCNIEMNIWYIIFEWNCKTDDGLGWMTYEQTGECLREFQAWNKSTHPSSETLGTRPLVNQSTN